MKRNSSLIQVLVAAILILGALFPPLAAARAQAVEPPVPEETSGEAAESVEAPGEQSSDTQVETSSTEEAPGVETAGESPFATEPPAAPAPEAPDSDPGEEQMQTQDLGEIVEVLSETNTVLVDENDDNIPLTSAEAADALSGSDPFFYDAYSGTYIGYTSKGGTCVSVVDQCYQVDNPLTTALADSSLPADGTLYLMGNIYYDEDVVINSNLSLRGGVEYIRKMDGSFTYTPIQATIRQVTLNSALGSLDNVQAQKVLINAKGDAEYNGEMLHDALDLVAQDGMVSLSAGMYQDNDTDFDVNRNGVTLEGVGDATQINGNDNDDGAGIHINGSDVKVRKLKVIDSKTGIWISGSNAQIDHVTAANNDYGIIVGQGVIAGFDYINLTGNNYGMIVVSTAMDATLHHSNIFGNHLFGLYNDCFFRIDPDSPDGYVSCSMMSATENYWGSPDGPTVCYLEDGTGIPHCDSENGDAIVQGKTMYWNDPSWPISMTIHQNIDFSNYADTYICNDGDPGTDDSFEGGQCVYTPHPDDPDDPNNPDVSNNPGNSDDPGDPADEGNEPPGFIGAYDMLAASPVIPVTGTLNQLSCSQAETLALGNGSTVAFSAPLCGYEAGLVGLSADALPAPLPAGLIFVSGMTLGMQNGGIVTTALPESTTDTLSFVVPEEMKGRSFVILRWDASAQGGLGGWVEVASGPGAAVTTNFSGIFVLAAR